MKCRLFAVAVLALFVTCIFGGSAMANNTLEGLAGTWVEVDPERKALPWRREHSSPGLYRVVITGDKLLLKEGDIVLADTIFRLDAPYQRNSLGILFNMQKRENWQAYSGNNQHIGSFGPFYCFDYREDGLVGVVFIHDLGGRELLFKRE